MALNRTAYAIRDSKILDFLITQLKNPPFALTELHLMPCRYSVVTLLNLDDGGKLDIFGARTILQAL